MNKPSSTLTTEPETVPARSQSGSPLPAAEIESLLRMARTNMQSMPAASQAEELGPGDVQYLRGYSTSYASSVHSHSNPSEPMEFSDDYERISELTELESNEAAFELNSQPIQASAEVLQEINAPSQPDSTARGGLTIEDLAEVDLDISIELGRTEILIEDILKLREGSVVSLDKLAGDPVDIVANGRLVARGELLVIDGKFGVRLSEIL